MIKELIYLIIVILGIPTGLFLAKICKDEIKAWRKRLIIFILACFIIGIWLFFIDFVYKIPVIITLGFIIAMFLTIVVKKTYFY
ncbi:MAG: hypothetical protein PHF67_03650 [Candidatus Nanoarchaeia archaeon]|nr:hypothetical protein [Candidatus Nanoarchaeia archaeon]